jgi:serine/threonine-protein kinase
VGRYEVRGVLGMGASGTIYDAWDPKMQRPVAVKLLRQAPEDRKVKERFRREARAVAALNHPSIMQIHDYSGVDSPYLFLVVEKLHGTDLRKILRQRGMLPETVTAAVGHELCSALAVAHEQGIIHRDLKPANVMLTTDGRVVLTDFGIVKAVREGSAVDGFHETTDIVGTPGYMAPEQLGGGELGPHTDLFALGALLYYAGTGRPAFPGQPWAAHAEMMDAISRVPYIDPREHNALLGDEICAVIGACLRSDPQARPQSTASVRVALRNVLTGNGVIDLRDDLSDYAEAPHAYGLMSRCRAVRCLREQILIAEREGDRDRSAQLRKRLERFVPAIEDAGPDDEERTAVLRAPTVSRRQTLAGADAPQTGMRLPFVFANWGS